MNTAEPIDSAASAPSEWRPATMVSVTPKAMTASWPASTVPAWRKTVVRSEGIGAAFSAGL